MSSINLIDAFQDFKEAENIDRPTMMKVVEDVFKTLLRKKFGSDENFDVIVNAEKGDLEIIRRRMIVEDGQVEDPAPVAQRGQDQVERRRGVGVGRLSHKATQSYRYVCYGVPRLAGKSQLAHPKVRILHCHRPFWRPHRTLSPTGEQSGHRHRGG